MLIQPHLGQLVRAHRKKAGLTQLALAQMVGIGKTVVFDLEKGKETIQVDSLLKIFRGLNISVTLNSPIMAKLTTHAAS